MGLTLKIQKTTDLLTREALLKKQELKVEQLDFEDGEYIFVREMTGRERDIFERSIYEFDKDNKPVNRLEDFRAKLAVCTICDEEGNLLLKPTDVQALSNNMGARKLELIVDKAQELNKISQKDKDGLTKNSGAGGPGSSNSGSAKS